LKHDKQGVRPQQVGEAFPAPVKSLPVFPSGTTGKELAIHDIASTWESEVKPRLS
jgi:hypothetical protein